MTMLACVFSLGFATGVLVGAFQIGVHAVAKEIERQAKR